MTRLTERETQIIAVIKNAERQLSDVRYNTPRNKRERYESYRNRVLLAQAQAVIARFEDWLQ